MAAVASSSHHQLPRSSPPASPGDRDPTPDAPGSNGDAAASSSGPPKASSQAGRESAETNGRSSAANANGASSDSDQPGPSRPASGINPIFEVKEKVEHMGEDEAHLERAKDGSLVVKPGKPPSRGWIPWRKSDRDVVLDGGVNLTRPGESPACHLDQDGADRSRSAVPRINGANGDAEQDPDPTFSHTSSGVDSVRMKIFTKLLPEDVQQTHPASPERTDRLEVSRMLDVRPRSPGHSTKTSVSGDVTSVTSSPPQANGDLPPARGASVEGSPRKPTSPIIQAADAAAEGKDPQGLDGATSEAGPSSAKMEAGGSAQGQAVVGHPEGHAVANSRIAPSADEAGRSFATAGMMPQFTPPADGQTDDNPFDRAPPSPTPARRAVFMQRANTTGASLEVSGSPRPLESSSSRLVPPPSGSPSLGPRTKSHDPSSLRRNTYAKDGEGPVRQRSGDDFEDEMARKADVMRKERRDRRAEAEKEGPDKEKDKGKRRLSHAGPDAPKREVLVGNLIGEGHVNYVMMYNMLTGIRIGVSRCQAKPKRPLTDEDYTARHKFSFDIVGNELTPSAKYDFKFKDYAPWVFRELREYFHLDPADYLLSLTAKYILSELGSPGKSGSFFYFSRDYRFIIKTIHHSEHKFLRKILKQYHNHVKKNPHTLLSRFYGLHRVKLPHGRKIHFVIMNNLFPPHRDIHETYDLKGSSIGREYPEEKAATKPGAVLKDLNWVKRGRVLDIGPEKREFFYEQLRRDTELLQRLGIMDYSLLIGFHNMTRGNRDKLRDDQLRVFQPDTVRQRRPTQVKRDRDKAASALRKAVQQSDPKALSEKNRLPDKDRSERRHFIFYQDEGGFQATDENDDGEPMIYYLGIIDILTPYSCIKRIEHVWKGMSNDKHAISAVPPVEYGNRFLGFLFSVVRGASLSTRPKGLLVGPAQDQPQPLPPGDPAEKPPPTLSGEKPAEAEPDPVAEGQQQTKEQ